MDDKELQHKKFTLHVKFLIKLGLMDVCMFSMD